MLTLPHRYIGSYIGLACEKAELQQNGSTLETTNNLYVDSMSFYQILLKINKRVVKLGIVGSEVPPAFNIKEKPISMNVLRKSPIRFTHIISLMPQRIPLNAVWNLHSLLWSISYKERWNHSETSCLWKREPLSIIGQHYSTLPFHVESKAEETLRWWH